MIDYFNITSIPVMVILPIVVVLVVFFVIRWLVYPIANKFSDLNENYQRRMAIYRENYSLAERVLYWFLELFFEAIFAFGTVIMLSNAWSFFIYDFGLIGDQMAKIVEKSAVILLSLTITIIGFLGLRFVYMEKQRRINKESHREIQS